MIIGIDARPLQNNNKYRGIGKYTEHLLIALSKKLSEQKIVFYLDKTFPLPIEILNKFSDYSIKYVKPNYISKIKYVRAFARPYTRIKPTKKTVDVLLQTDPWGGIPKSVPTIAVFHDLIPLLFKVEDSVKLEGLAKLKNGLSKRVAESNYMSVLNSYKNAICVVAVSESSKYDYIKYLDKKPKNKIVVISEALIGGKDNIVSSDALLKQYRLKKNSYFLYVGGIDIRKNVPQLIHDLHEVNKLHPRVKLVLAGKEFELTNDLKRIGWSSAIKSYPGIEKNIIYTGYVDQEHMAPLFQNAIAFVTPTRYEGFGLQILEAFDAECPVVCYKNSSLIEVAGNAALMIDDGKPQYKALLELIENRKLRDELIIKGKKQLSKFSWDKTASMFFSLFTKVK